MKKILIVSLISLMAIFCLNQAHAKDIEKAFMGIKWGQDIVDIKGFTKLYAKKEVVYYINPDEIHTLNNVQIPDVVYGFFKGQFFAVYIGVETIEIFDDMRRYLKSEFGLPDRSISTKNQETIYKWKYQNIKIKLKVREEDNRMKLAFYYMPLSSTLNEEQLETFHDKANRFFPVEKNKTPEMIPLLKF